MVVAGGPAPGRRASLTLFYHKSGGAGKGDDPMAMGLAKSPSARVGATGGRLGWRGPQSTGQPVPLLRRLWTPQPGDPRVAPTRTDTDFARARVGLVWLLQSPDLGVGATR